MIFSCGCLPHTDSPQEQIQPAVCQIGIRHPRHPRQKGHCSLSRKYFAVPTVPSRKIMCFLTRTTWSPKILVGGMASRPTLPNAGVCKKLGDYSSLPNQPYPFNMRLPITPIADYDVSFPNLLVEPPFLQKAKLLLKCTQIIVLTITNAFWKYRFNSESDAFVA